MTVPWILATIGTSGQILLTESVPGRPLSPAPAADLPLVPIDPIPYLLFVLFFASIGVAARTIGWARAGGLDRLLLGVGIGFGLVGFVLTLKLVLLFSVVSAVLSWVFVGRYAGEGGHGGGTSSSDRGQMAAMDRGSDDAVSVDDLDVEPPGHDFDDVAGMDDLLDTLEDRVISPLNDPQTYAEYGIGAVNGVLFHGPPGCGKTYVAGAVAGETDYNYLEVTPTEITSRYVGEAADNVASLFETARENAPCLVFIDEIDAIAGERSGRMNTSEQQMVNQLLVELEGQADSGVVVFAATNYVEDVDGAILRSGRFDERIEVPPPDHQARRELLALELADAPSDPDLDFEGIADATAGFAASDVELLAEVASRHAIADDQPVRQEHLVRALDETDTSIPGWLEEYRHWFDGDIGRGGARHRRPFSDVPGMETVIDDLTDRIVDPVRNAGRYEAAGLDPVDGALLYGPPDCGTTTLAGSIAAELDRDVIEVSPARLRREGTRDAADRVAEIVEDARAGDPSILLLDDLDDLAPRGGAREYRGVGSELETLLPSLSLDDVFVVGTARRPDGIAVDVLHCGAFDERIEVPPPDAETRIAVLRDVLPARVFSEDVDWTAVAEAMDGFSIRDCRHLGGTVGRDALREERRLRTADLVEAAERTEATLSAGRDGPADPFGGAFDGS